MGRLRVTGGHLRGRLFAGPVAGTRPTSDRVREAIASALVSRDLFTDAYVLDLFCGTGAMSFEALSRGANEALLLDGDRQVAQKTRASSQSLGIQTQTTVRALDLLGAPNEVASHVKASMVHRWSLIFSDAPYAESQRAAQLIFALREKEVFENDAVVVFESSSRTEIAWAPLFEVLSTYRYGETLVTFARVSAP